MNEIEAIDLLSSDSDDSDEDELQVITEPPDTSFVTKRIQQVIQDHSSLLFEDQESAKEKNTKTPLISPVSISTELLNRKRTRNQEEEEEEKKARARINATIFHEESTLSSEHVSSIPSALAAIGVTEEEDKMNTNEVRHLIDNYANQNDVSLQSILDSILSEADSTTSESSNKFGQLSEDFSMSEEDISILHPSIPIHASASPISAEAESSVIVTDDESDMTIGETPMVYSDPDKTESESSSHSLVKEGEGVTGLHCEGVTDLNCDDCERVTGLHCEGVNDLNCDGCEEEIHNNLNCDASQEIQPANSNNLYTLPHPLQSSRVLNADFSQETTNPLGSSKVASTSPNALSRESSNKQNKEPKSIHEEDIMVLSISDEDTPKGAVSLSSKAQSCISLYSDSDNSSEKPTTPIEDVVDLSSDDSTPSNHSHQIGTSEQTSHGIVVDDLDGFISSYVKGCSQQTHHSESDDSTQSSEPLNQPLLSSLSTPLLSPQSAASVPQSPLGSSKVNSLTPSFPLDSSKMISLTPSYPLDSSKMISPSLSFPLNSSQPSSPTHTISNALHTQTPSHPDSPVQSQSSVPYNSLNVKSLSRKSQKQRHKTLLVCIEEELEQSKQGSDIVKAIRPLCHIGPGIHCPVRGVIVMMRQVDSEFLIINDCLTVIMEGSTMINLIKESGLEGGLARIKEVRSLLLSDSRQKLFLILTNMQNIIAEQRKKRRQSILPFTKDLLTELYIRLRLDCNITCFPCESETAATEWVVKIIQCIRDGPYQQPLTELGVATKSKTFGITFQDSFDDQQLVLFRMLQCIPGVSSTKAVAVLSYYHSISELKEAYDKLPTLEMKEDLLSDKLGGSSKQRQLSKRIYDTITCTDENWEL